MARTKITVQDLREAERKIKELSFKGQASSIEHIRYLHTQFNEFKISSSTDALELYFLVIQILELDRQASILTSKDWSKLMQTAETALRYCQIQPISSQHSSLYTRLAEFAAFLKMRSGKAWQSSMDIVIGEYLGRDSSHEAPVDLLLRAWQAWGRQHIESCCMSLHSFILQKLDHGADRFAAMILLLRALRINGQVVEAEEIHRQAMDEWAQVESAQRILEAINVTSLYQTLGEGKILKDYLSEHGGRIPPFEAERIRLWIYCSRLKDPISQAGQVAQSSYFNYPCPHSWSQQALNLRKLFDFLYSQEEPLQNRLAKLSAQIDMMKTESLDCELSLLFWAGSLRWARRLKQYSLAQILLEEYRLASLQLSLGKTKDALACMADVMTHMPEHLVRQAQKVQTKIPSGLLPRILKLTPIILRAAWHSKAIALLQRETFRQDWSIQEEERVHQFLSDLQSCMGELRGPIMKLCQGLAMSRLVSPQGQAILQAIYKETPALDFSVFEPVLNSSWKKPLNEIFDSFSDTPRAVSSIAQVYQARLKSGELVAVKIRYPDIEQIIRSDTWMTRFLKPLYSKFYPSELLNELINIFEQRLVRECDYISEAQAQENFFQVFKGDSKIRIPRVFHELCTADILVTEWIEAPQIEDFLLTAGAEERNRICEQIHHFAMSSCIHHGLLHMDVHLGNFLVDREQVVVLDFGAVYQLTNQQRTSFQSIFQKRVKGDVVGLYEELSRVQYIFTDKLSLEGFEQELAHHLMRPYHESKIRPYYLPEDHPLMVQVFRRGLEQAFRPVTTEIFQIGVLLALEDLFALIGGELNWHEQLSKILEKP